MLGITLQHSHFGKGAVSFTTKSPYKRDGGYVTITPRKDTKQMLLLKESKRPLRFIIKDSHYGCSVYVVDGEIWCSDHEVYIHG